PRAAVKHKGGPAGDGDGRVRYARGMGCRGLVLLLAAASGCTFELGALVTIGDGGAGGGGAASGGQGGQGGQGGSVSHTTYEIAVDYPSGAASETLVDVPVLGRLTPARFDYGLAAADGSDVRFRDAEDQLLAHEIESW